MDRVIPRHDHLVVRSALVTELIPAFCACVALLVVRRPRKLRVPGGLGVHERLEQKEKGNRKGKPVPSGCEKRAMYSHFIWAL